MNAPDTTPLTSRPRTGHLVTAAALTTSMPRPLLRQDATFTAGSRGYNELLIDGVELEFSNTEGLNDAFASPDGVRMTARARAHVSECPVASCSTQYAACFRI